MRTHAEIRKGILEVLDVDKACKAAHDAEDPLSRGDYRSFRNGFFAAHTMPMRRLTREESDYMAKGGLIPEDVMWTIMTTMQGLCARWWGMKLEEPK